MALYGLLIKYAALLLCAVAYANSASLHSNDGSNFNHINENHGAGNDDPSEAASICKEKGSNGVLVAHEKCNYFYECDNHKPVARPCPKGLFFNPKKDQCDWPHNVHCGDRTRPGDDDDEDNDCEHNEGGGANNDDPNKAPFICKEKGSNGVLVAHEKCNYFYQCDNHKPVARPCPKYLFFNPKKDQCDWRHNVHCGDRTTGHDRDHDHFGEKK